MQMSSEGGEAIHVGSTEIETDYEHQNTHLLPVDSPFPGPCHFMLGRRKSLVYTTLSKYWLRYIFRVHKDRTA